MPAGHANWLGMKQCSAIRAADAGSGPFVLYTGHVFPEVLAALGAHAAIFRTLPLKQGLANDPCCKELILGGLRTAKSTSWQSTKKSLTPVPRAMVDVQNRDFVRCYKSNVRMFCPNKIARG